MRAERSNVASVSPAANAIGNAFRSQLDRTFHRAVRARSKADGIEQIASAAQAELAKNEDTHPLLREMAQRLGLAALHCDLVSSVVACSVDARIAPHLEALGGSHARRGLSLPVYAVLAELDDDSIVALSTWLARANPFLSSGLLTVSGPATSSACTYAASPRLIAFLEGYVDVTDPLHLVRVNKSLLHDARQSAAIQEIAKALSSNETVIVIEGPIGSGRSTAVACASVPEVVVLDCARIAGEQLGEALHALRRELLLCPRLPVLANVDHVASEENRQQRRLLGEFIDSTEGPLVVTSTIARCELGTNRPIIRVPWDVPDTDTRARLWSAAVQTSGSSLQGDVSPLAFRYRVGPEAIERAVTSARAAHQGDAPLDESALAAGLRHNIAERLGGLATRVEVTQTWEDLVIADDTADLIEALLGRVRHAHQVLDLWGYRQKIARGAGVAALFSGPPGTGKTMVAGLIARALDLELYQVDLSKVVSKWIGETEKNLARVFDAAEEGHALLLFDEADALFGQRSSDMKSANDRYANLEVNYLLQRVEAFGGITILTTNLETAIDTALKRRLAAHVVFAKPDEDERAALWERQCKTGHAPIDDDVNPERLASLFPNMSGANIRNAALSAAFLAAADKSARITQEHLMRAGRAEYRSMGHVLADSLSLRSKERRGL